MQDNVFGGYTDVTTHKSQSNSVLWPKINYIHTCDTHFKGITDHIWFIYSFIFYPSTTRPVIFLPVHNRFYPSKWRPDRSLYKAMVWLSYEITFTYKLADIWGVGKRKQGGCRTLPSVLWDPVVSGTPGDFSVSDWSLSSSCTHSGCVPPHSWSKPPSSWNRHVTDV